MSASQPLCPQHRRSEYHPSCVVAFTCLHTLHAILPFSSQHPHHRHPRFDCYQNHCRRTRFISPFRPPVFISSKRNCLPHPNVYSHGRNHTVLTSTSTTNDADQQQPSSIPVPPTSPSRPDFSGIAPLSRPPKRIHDDDEQLEIEEATGKMNSLDEKPPQALTEHSLANCEDENVENHENEGQDPVSTSESGAGLSDSDSTYSISVDESPSSSSSPSPSSSSSSSSISTSQAQSLQQSTVSSTKKKPRYVPGRTVAEIEGQLKAEAAEQQRLAQQAISRGSVRNSGDNKSDATNSQKDDASSTEDDVIFSISFSLSELMRQEGHLAEANGEHSLAVQLYLRAVELDTHNGKAWQNLAKCEGRRKRSMRANANVLRRAIDHNPRNPYLFQSLGFVLFRMRQYDEARNNFQVGISRDPNHAPLYSTWAHLEYALRNITKARQLYQKGCSLKVADTSSSGSTSAPNGVARVYHNWGNMELKLGNQQRAIELFEKGLQIEPYNCYIWETLGSIAKKENRIDRARECYQNALKSNETNVVVYEALAKLEASCGNTDLARGLFEKGVELEIRDARILQSWAQFEMRLDRYQAAKEKIEKAVLLSPTDSMLWTQYARIEACLKHFPRARAMFNRACEINPKDWRAWDAWSIMEHDLGNFEQAEKLLHESFRVRFNAKGDFSILANSVTDRFTHN